MKPGAKIAITVCALGLIAGVLVHLHWPFYRISRIRSEFSSIQLGDTEAIVRQKLASATLRESLRAAPYWDDTPLESDTGKQIRMSLCETIDTFYIPVSFVISFDASGRVIGKHIYD